MIALLLACATPTLTLNGPTEVRVTALGPVDGPHAALSTGEPAAGVSWATDAPAVAAIDGEQVTAVGPGQATVTGTWEGQSVAWSLIVAPPMSLAWMRPPASVAVGQRVQLEVTGQLGDATAPVSDVAWRTSDAAIATVDAAGAVQGVSAGVVYVTATHGTSEAMLELEVR
jgi:hypothetical protein